MRNWLWYDNPMNLEGGINVSHWNGIVGHLDGLIAKIDSLGESLMGDVANPIDLPS